MEWEVARLEPVPASTRTAAAPVDRWPRPRTSDCQIAQHGPSNIICGPPTVQVRDRRRICGAHAKHWKSVRGCDLGAAAGASCGWPSPSVERDAVAVACVPLVRGARAGAERSFPSGQVPTQRREMRRGTVGSDPIHHRSIDVTQQPMDHTQARSSSLQNIDIALFLLHAQRCSGKYDHDCPAAKPKPHCRPPFSRGFFRPLDDLRIPYGPTPTLFHAKAEPLIDGVSLRSPLVAASVGAPRTPLQVDDSSRMAPTVRPARQATLLACGCLLWAWCAMVFDPFGRGPGRLSGGSTQAQARRGRRPAF